MNSDHETDLAEEFGKWAEEVGTTRVSETLGIPARTIRRKRQEVGGGKPLSGETKDAFVEWMGRRGQDIDEVGEDPGELVVRESSEKVEGGDVGEADLSVLEDIQGADDTPSEDEPGPDETVDLDWSYDGTGEQPEEERIHWRDLYQRMPGVVPAAAYVDEAEYFGDDEAEELLRWRLYRQILADDLAGGPLAWVPNRSQRLWYMNLRKLTLALEIELISSRELTLPPGRVQYDTLQRRREIARRQEELSGLERETKIVRWRELVYSLLGWPLRTLVSLLIWGKSGGR